MSPKDQDPTGKDRPNLRVVPPARKDKNKPLTVEAYRAAEEWWCRNQRSPTALSIFLGCSKRSAVSLVHNGLRRLGLRPLKEAAQEYDQIQEQARQKALRNQVDLEADELARAKRLNLQTSSNLRVLGTEFLVRIRALMQGLGPVDGVVGEAAVGAKARAMQPLATMFRSISIAMREAASAEFAWIKGTAPSKDEDNRDMAKDLEGVSTDQWAHYMRTGEWPPGMNPDALKALVRQGLATPGSGG